MIAKIALIASLFLSQAIAAATPGDGPVYRFSRPILWQDGGRQSLLAVPLDGAVYAVSASDFRDLRLTDQNGVETPYLLQKIAASKTEIRRLPSRSETQGLEKIDDEGIVITVNLDKDAASADGLTVVTSQRDFEYNLQIHGSNDGEKWEKLVNNTAIYDYSRYMAVGNRDIELPSNSYRQFKIIVAKASQTRTEEVLELTRTMHGAEELQRSEKTELHDEPLHIERIEFWHKHSETRAEAEQRFDYPVTLTKISQDVEHKTTLIAIETRRQPLTGFTLKTATPNFSRQAEVQIPLQPGMETRQQTLGRATLEALHFQDINRDQSDVTFPEQRQPKYQIVIRNQDNPALEIESVTGYGPGYQLLFLPRAGQNYQLRYGSDRAEAPRYDIAPIRELLRRGYQSTSVEVGPETVVATVEHKPDFGELLNSKWFLGGAIGLMVLVLGWSLYRVGKRVGDLPE
jgi:hypothetical protein